jgi:hypothetical protein
MMDHGELSYLLDLLRIMKDDLRAAVVLGYMLRDSEDKSVLPGEFLGAVDRVCECEKS